MTGAGGPLGRDGMAFGEKMKRLHGEIERLVYAAERACDTMPGELRDCMNCSFNIKISEPICPVVNLRVIIGDHIIHHDVMPQVPPCQCGKCHQ